MKVSCSSAARLDPVDRWNWLACRRTRETSGCVVSGDFHASQLRSMTKKLIDCRLIKRSTTKSVWTVTRRCWSTTKHFTSVVVQSFQPNRRTVTTQRVFTEPQMLKHREHRLQACIKLDYVVTIQPQIFDCGIEWTQNTLCEMVQRTVV